MKRLPVPIASVLLISFLGFLLGCGPDAGRIDGRLRATLAELDLVSLFTSAAEEIPTNYQGPGGASLQSQPSPWADAENRELHFPFGSGLSYYLRTGASGSRLDIAGIRVLGGEGTLWVTIAADGLRPTRYEIPASAGPVAWELPDAMAGIIQLNLTAVPFQNTAPSTGVLVLEQPLLRLWKSEAEERTELERLTIKPHPNVLLYIVDTVRADHIGLYGYEPEISPRVDAFADRSIAFMDAVAQTPWTRASVASILTGLYPDNHHTNTGDEKLAKEFVTLAEVLSEKGYETAALVTNGNLAPEFDLGQGFQTYVHLKERGVEVHRRAAELHEEAISWLDERSKERPFFLYLHATDPHAPYTPPFEYQEEFAPNLRYPEARSLEVIAGLFKGERQADDDLRNDLISLYDAEIAYWDHEFGNLLDHLENAGLADNTIVVLVSDHGEEFAEHGRWQHSTSVHSELIQVPFVIRLPLEWGAGTQVTSPVQHVDIFPTLLDLLGISGEEVKVQLDGRSLVSDITGAEVAVTDVRSSLRTRSRIIADCVVGSRFKLIRHWSDNEPTSHLLFDRAHDPGELRDIARHNPIAVEFFRRQLSSVAIDPGSLPRAEMESETRDALKALGYID